MWPGRPAAWCKDLDGAAAEFGEVGQQRHGVEVALNGAVVADHLPGVVQPHAPIDADHARPAFGQQRQQLRVARGEADYRHSGRDAADRPAARAAARNGDSRLDPV